MVVGGSGLYVDAILKGFDEFPSRSFSSHYYKTQITKTGNRITWQNLKVLDPNYYQNTINRKSTNFANPRLRSAFCRKYA
jgi:tRNA dimethylallyltransferase